MMESAFGFIASFDCTDDFDIEFEKKKKSLAGGGGINKKNVLNAKSQHSAGESPSKHKDCKYSTCLFIRIALSINKHDVEKCMYSEQNKTKNSRVHLIYT